MGISDHLMDCMILLHLIYDFSACKYVWFLISFFGYDFVWFYCMGFLLTSCHCVGCLISWHGISDFKFKYMISEHGTQSDVPFNWNQTFHAVISDNPCNATRHHPHAMKSYIIGIWNCILKVTSMILCIEIPCSGIRKSPCKIIHPLQLKSDIYD